MNFLFKKNDYECRIDSLNANITSLSKRLTSDQEEYEYATNNFTARLSEQDKKVCFHLVKLEFFIV